MNLLNILLSNCTLNDGNLYPTYISLFDIFVKEPYCSNWLPQQNDFRTFCMSDETEKVYQKLEKAIGIC